ncbi:type VI secretion system accessory protein TagJ [Acetobacter sp. DsW_063]|uniref:type VI secretion system accessory protein TagJ n=1 Tax=Acetobacter sp. DsW_063 TaxID=1514894 RepID=UPI000A3B79DB|nr:type VI secretion system accessory protein TagJ [Acetobacter sp. DsW_063]OUJ16199.1 hypothetical protein HK28_02995 [Acetobacter sp. DsW_063]
MTTETVDALFQRGDLSGALAAAVAAVKASPAAAGPRLLLAELALFSGDLQRAETMLTAIESIEPKAALIAAEFRQLLRAETQRRAVFADGALPEFLQEPTAVQQESLRALTALRSGDDASAQGAVKAAEDARPHPAGERIVGADTIAFDDFRDADDIIGGTTELLTSTGKYFWIPNESLISLHFHDPVRPRDLYWRRCTAMVRNGPEGDVYIPATYPLTTASDDDALRLGRSTDWTDSEPVRGIGRRMFLIGEESLDVMELGTLEFS